MIAIIPIIGFILFFVTAIIAISYRQHYQSNKILSNLNTDSFKKINISYSQISIGKGSIVGGLPFKAIMYLSDNLLVITPKGRYFSGLFCLNLPLVIVKDQNETRMISGLERVVRPDKISLTSLNTINMSLYLTVLFYRKYNVQISAIDKTDIESLSILKKWC